MVFSLYFGGNLPNGAALYKALIAESSYLFKPEEPAILAFTTFPFWSSVNTKLIDLS